MRAYGILGVGWGMCQWCGKDVHGGNECPACMEISDGIELGTHCKHGNFIEPNAPCAECERDKSNVRG